MKCKHKMQSDDITRKKAMEKVKTLELALGEQDYNLEVLPLIIEVVKSVKLSTDFIIQLLKFCIRVESENVVKQILSSQNVDLKTSEEGTILCDAIATGNIAITTLLVRANADVNVCDDINCSLLHQVLRSRKIKNETEKIEFVKLLLENGADVNAFDNVGFSVLHRAIKCNDCSSELIDILVQYGANVIFEGEPNLDYFFHNVCDRRPEILLKLIDYQVTDDQTRNKRRVIAINYLMMSKHEKALTIMKNILDLGVQVDTIYHVNDLIAEPTTLLHKALSLKNEVAIKLLLDYGADPNQKDRYGSTALFRATVFKDSTNASRWLIEHGASVHARNTDGRYPIHGACLHDSERNIHLLLNLDAKLDVMDVDGLTPFYWTGDKSDYTSTQCFIIKYFALYTERDLYVFFKDWISLDISRNYQFAKCTLELGKMQNKMICDDISYYSLLSEDMFSMLQLMKNPTFSVNFKRYKKKRIRMFPEYSNMLLQSFEIAKKRYDIFFAEKERLQEILSIIFPDVVIDRVVFCLSYEKLTRCRYDYYMSLHAGLKIGKAYTKKIL
ncbi:ankyrin-1-like [Phymastichus coffea]|uniref:ankyrin-1-like n=1 Tax=Phymastichus coffea TaxID=108790 RepID=UPI00273A7CD7|nr:ankyrin-1-like [Phymastichus coffea]